MSNQLIINFN